MSETNMSTIELGATGQDVQILQAKLRILGFYAGQITGSFGTTTEEAVRSFQRNNDLNPTGVVDNTTWQLLFEQTPSQFPTRRASLPTLQLGSTGEYVSLLQRQLKQLLVYDGEITGTYDQATFNAVKVFQFINNLTMTGVVNNDTWSALNYLYAPLAECGEEETPEQGEYYTVQSGDTLWNIARKFNTTVDELKALNNLTSDTLSVGQKLLLKAPTETIPPEDYDIYTVKSGDTLYGIANLFGITVAELKRINNLTNDTLSVGQQLYIPKTAKEPEENYQTYIVQSGDTLYGIANRYGITVDEIKRINNLAGNTLTIGQQLFLPQTEALPEPKPEETYINYTVRSGDTLYGIASRYGVSVDEIKRMNNLTGNTLSIGQVLTIPTNSTSPYLEYTVKAGDSLWNIANRYGTTVDKIKQINGLTSNTLSIGQILRIET